MGRRPTLFTLGYQGRSIEEVASLLNDHGVRLLVDVRQDPVSRKKGFSALGLLETMRKHGIDYRPVRGLGNPPEFRELFRRGRLEEGRRHYRDLLENGRREHLQDLVMTVRETATAIMCFERDRLECHRTVVAQMAEELEPELEVVHL